MASLLNSIYNSTGTEPEKVEAPKPKKTLLEDVFKTTTEGNATNIPLGQYGVGQSEYDTNVTPENVVNLEEIRAQKQGALDKWGNGLIKAAGTFGTGILENTAGVVTGIGNAIIDKDINKLYNNPFTQSLDEFNNYIAQNFPNYHTQAEQEYNLIEKLGTSNFWSDQALNGAAFLGSAVATGAGLGRLASLGKLARAGVAVNEAELAATGWQALDRAAKTIKIADAADFAKNAAIMSFGESSIEARSIYNDTKEALIQQYTQTSGVEPSPEMLQEIESRAKAAGNFGFATNLAITGATNALLFPKLLTKGYDATKLGINNIALKGGQFVAEQAPIAKSVGKELIKGSLEEGGQELGQLLTQKTLTDYYSKGYENRGEKADFISSLMYGFQETFGTEEGLENFFLGALLGGPAGAIQTRGETSQRNQNTAQVAAIMNTEAFKNTVKSFDSFVRASNFEQEKEEALATGNKFDFLNAEFNQNKSIAKQFIDLGATDILLNQYKDIQNLPEEEFKKITGYAENETLPKSQIEIVSNAIKFVENLDRTNKSIQQLFPYNQAIHGTPERYKVVTDNLWHYSTSIDNVNTRIKEINNEFFRLASDKGVQITGDSNSPDFVDTDANPMDLQQLAKLRDDLQVAKVYRSKMIESYNLLANPRTQNETVDTIINTAEAKAIESMPIQPTQPVEEVPVVENEVVQAENVDPSSVQPENVQSEVLREGQTDPTIPIETAQTEQIDFSTLINNSTSERELDSILTQIDNQGIASPELINQINLKREDLTTKAPIDINFGNKRYRAQNVWKTTAGQDNDKKLPEQRYFRFLRESKIPKDAKLQVVTKNNNPELFNQLLDEGARNYEKKTGINTIYTVLVDKNNKPIYASQKGERIKSGDTKNLVYSTLITPRGLEITGLKNSDLARQDLTNFRDKLMEQTSSGIFLPITGRSKGVPVENAQGQTEFRNRYLTFDPVNIEISEAESIEGLKPLITESRISDFTISEEELQSIEETINDPLLSPKLRNELTTDLRNVKSEEELGALYKKICSIG